MNIVNLFPVRVPIGRVQMPNNQQAIQMNGQALDVMMTPEFSRALSDIFTRTSGNTSASTEDFTLLDSFTITPSLPGGNDAGAAQNAPIDQSAQISAMQAQIDAMRAEIDAVAPYAVLAQQLEDIRILIDMASRPAPAKYTVTGSRAGNVALASLLTALASSGLITDSTTP